MAISKRTNARFDHVFVVLRDDGSGDDVPTEARVTVTKVFADEEAARTDVERLNTVNNDKGCHYFYQLGRFDDRGGAETRSANER